MGEMQLAIEVANQLVCGKIIDANQVVKGRRKYISVYIRKETDTEVRLTFEDGELRAIFLDLTIVRTACFVKVDGGWRVWVYHRYRDADPDLIADAVTFEEAVSSAKGLFSSSFTPTGKEGPR